MAITLELPSDVEARLIGQARAYGIPVEAYLEELIARGAPTHMDEAAAAGLRDRLMELAAEWHRLPTLDPRSADDIIGYDEFGLPRP